MQPSCCVDGLWPETEDISVNFMCGMSARDVYLYLNVVSYIGTSNE